MTELERQAELVKAHFNEIQPKFKEAESAQNRMIAVQRIIQGFTQILEYASKLGNTTESENRKKLEKLHFSSNYLMMNIYKAFHIAPNPKIPEEFFGHLVSKTKSGDNAYNLREVEIGFELIAARELFTIASKLFDAVPNAALHGDVGPVNRCVKMLSKYQSFIDEIAEGKHTQHLVPKATAAEATVALGGNPLPENRESLGEKANYFHRNGSRGSNVSQLFSREYRR